MEFDPILTSIEDLVPHKTYQLRLRNANVPNNLGVPTTLDRKVATFERNEFRNNRTIPFVYGATDDYLAQAWDHDPVGVPIDPMMYTFHAETEGVNLNYDNQSEVNLNFNGYPTAPNFYENGTGAPAPALPPPPPAINFQAHLAPNPTEVLTRSRSNLGIDPITQDEFENDEEVVLFKGRNLYKKEGLRRWLANKNTNPVNNEPITNVNNLRQYTLALTGGYRRRLTRRSKSRRRSRSNKSRRSNKNKSRRTRRS